MSESAYTDEDGFPFAQPEGSEATMFIQWKGTDVCMDFTCPCGYAGHIDGDFAYFVGCPACGAIWELGTAVVVRRAGKRYEDGSALQWLDGVTAEAYIAAGEVALRESGSGQTRSGGAVEAERRQDQPEPCDTAAPTKRCRTCRGRGYWHDDVWDGGRCTTTERTCQVCGGTGARG